MDDLCEHLEQVERAPAHVKPHSHGCEECLKIHREWVHLRLCLTCGHVGCCDDSPHRHATKHFHATRHPVIKSFEPGEDWAWCFVDELMVDEVPALPEQRPAWHVEPPAYT
jgi:uncharacterized UBP type Zn finger protein